MKSLLHSAINLISQAVINCFLITVLLATLVSSIFSYYFPRLDQYRPEILNWLNQHSQTTTVKAEKIVGHFEAFRPQLILEDVTIANPSWGESLTVSKLSVEFDVIKSIRQEKLIFSHLTLSDVNFSLVQLADGSWHFSNESQLSKEKLDIASLVESIWSVEEMQVNHVNVSLKPINSKALTLPTLYLKSLKSKNKNRFSLSFKQPNKVNKTLILIDAFGEPFQDDFIVKGFAEYESLAGAKVIDTFLSGYGIDVDYLDARIWFSFKNQQWELINYTQLQNINFNQSLMGMNLSALDHVSFSSKMHIDPAGYRIWVPSLEIKSGDIYYQQNKLYADKLDQWRFYIEQIDLDSLNQVLLSCIEKAKFKSLLAGLAPSGTVDQLVFEQKSSHFMVNALFSNFSNKTWRGIPASENIAGTMVLKPNQGQVKLNSQAGYLHFPLLYSAPHLFDKLQGSLNWAVKDGVLTLDAPYLEMHASAAMIKGAFSLDQPINEVLRQTEPGRLSLLLGIKKLAFTEKHSVIPDQKLPKALQAWLDTALVQGEAVDAGFIFHGPINQIEDDIKEQLSLQLFFAMNNAEIKYHDEFPAIRSLAGQLLFDDDHIQIGVNTGETLSAKLKPSQVKINIQKPYPKLVVDAGFEGNIQAAMSFLKLPIIEKQTGNFLDYVDFPKGYFSSQLKLDMPIEENFIKALKLNVVTQLDSVSARLKSMPIEVDQVKGKIVFDTSKGLTSENLLARFDGAPLKAKIIANNAEHSLIAFSSELQVEKLKKLFSMPLFNYFKGKSAIKGKLDLTKQQSKLTISSTLKGVEINLPAPFNKKVTESKPILFELPLSHGLTTMTIDYDIVKGQFILKEGQIDSAVIAFNQQGEINHDKNTLTITGRMPYANFTQWQKFISGYKEHSENRNNIFDLVIKQLTIEKLDFLDWQFSQLDLDAREVNKDWLFRIDHDDILGDIWLHNESQKGIVLDLDRLNLDYFTPVRSTSYDSKEVADYPILHFYIKHLIYQSGSLGRWQFSHFAKNNQLIFENIKMTNEDWQLGALNELEPAQLIWSREENSNTQFKALVKGENIKNLLSIFDYSSDVVSKQYQIAFDLTWSGGVTDFAFEKAAGRVQFGLKQGVFTEMTSSSTQAVKLLGLINLGHLLRRLKLDFSDLTKKGFSFDQVEGEFSLDKGVFQTDGAIKIISPSSQISFSGKSDIVRDELDLLMTVTLPLASNIPWIATLIATGATGLWPAAGVFLVSHLFKNQVDKLSTLVYEVKGKIADPSIRFKNLFDKAQTKKQQRKKTKKAKKN